MATQKLNIFPNDREGQFALIGTTLPVGASVDNIFYFQDGSNYYKRILDGKIRAAHCGLLSDGVNHGPRLTTALGRSEITEIYIDTLNGVIVVNDDVVVPQGKKLVFRNNCIISGTGSITGGIIEADATKKIFGSSFRVINTENSIVSIQWFGGKPDYNYDISAGTDNFPCWQKAYNSFSAYKQPRIYFPKPPVLYPNRHLGFFYRFGTNIGAITKTIHLFGDSEEQCTLLMDGSQLGIQLLGDGSTWRGLGIKGRAGVESGGYNSSTAHGLWVSCNSADIYRPIIENFDGDGLLISGDEGRGTNANQCHIVGSKLYANGRAGIHVQGGDANACHIEHPDVQFNAVYGEWYEDFLGNNMPSGHNASNCHGHSQNKTVITYGGIVYTCILDNIGIEPTVTSGWANYWKQISISPLFATAWNNTTQFHAGGAVRLDGVNGQGVITGKYVEGDQYTVIQNSTYLIIGGQLAGYGLVPGAIGNRLGKINALQWSCANGATLDTVEIAANTGIGTCGISWNGPNGSLQLMRVENNVFGFLVADYGPYLGPCFSSGGATFRSWTRTDVNPEHIFAMFRSGLYLGQAGGASIYRRVVFSSSAPSTGTFPIGSICLPTEGALADIIYWKCTVASLDGNGGTWEAVVLPTPPVLPVVVTISMEANGTDTVFTYPHGITGGVAADSPVFVQARSEDAMGNFYATIDNTNVYINYATAPIAGGGDNNLIFSIQIYQVTP